MGSGSWTRNSFRSYSTTKGLKTDETGIVLDSLSAQEMFKSRKLSDRLNPKNVIRQCVDSEEHPNTIPIILALDVTGSMGQSAVEVAKKLNIIMTDLYSKVKDVEFMIMGIGDLTYDYSPIQASQFESDIRIAEQLDEVYFEFGGGGNNFESYSAAWYFGLNNTELDCWKRGKKGIIITMGDERLNPYLPKNGRHNNGLNNTLGINLQDDVDTKELYIECYEKFEIYHLNVNHGYNYISGIKESFVEVIGEDNYYEVSLDTIANTIVDIIVKATNDNQIETKNDISITTNENGEITW